MNALSRSINWSFTILTAMGLGEQETDDLELNACVCSQIGFKTVGELYIGNLLIKINFRKSSVEI